MKTLKLVENGKGHFDIRSFGVSYTGADGKSPFRVVLESLDNKISIELPHMTIGQLFTKLDLHGQDFTNDNYSSTDFIKISTNNSADTITMVTTKVVAETFFSSQKNGTIKNKSRVKIIVFALKGKVSVFESTSSPQPKAA